jgi:CelD/BcsL family acetyltransferase involved in cellulose biosynthesis
MVHRVKQGWLRPAQLRRVAGFGWHRVGPSTGRSCRDVRPFLDAAESDGRNLSLLATRGRRFVAYLLAWLEPATPEETARGGATGGSSASNRSIRLHSLGHRTGEETAAAQLLTRLAWLVSERSDARDLPVRSSIPDRTFVRASAAAMDGALVDAMKRVRTYDGPRGRLTVGVVDSMAGWDRLRASWNALVSATTGAGVFQTHEFLRAWWTNIGWHDELWIVVVLIGVRPVAVLPLQASHSRWLARPIVTLSFIGQAPESDRPRALLGSDDQAGHAEVLAGYLLDEAGAWDRLVLDEQSPDDPFLGALIPRLQTHRYLVGRAAGPISPTLRIVGSWDRYLTTRNSAFRKSLKRKRSKFAALGHVSVGQSGHRDAQTALARYTRIERASWKRHSPVVGIHQRSNLMAFYRHLARHDAGALGMRFRFLRLDDRDVAATFGLVWQGRYHSLHISHDDAYDDYSPGVLLTAAEIQEMFDSGGCETFDFLSGLLPNKRSWVTHLEPSVSIYVDRPSLTRRLHHAWYFALAPRIEGWLEHRRLKPILRRLRERIEDALERYGYRP